MRPVHGRQWRRLARRRGRRRACQSPTTEIPAVQGMVANPVYERATRLLRPLPRLPKPHLSWPIYFGPSAANPQGPSPELEALLVQFARVTGAL
eukprot:SAG11_NODE_23903_length_381_cov_1.102837_1_plen_93_part_10